jgi:hypothetical protein
MIITLTAALLAVAIVILSEYLLSNPAPIRSTDICNCPGIPYTPSTPTPLPCTCP